MIYYYKKVFFTNFLKIFYLKRGLFLFFYFKFRLTSAFDLKGQKFAVFLLPLLLLRAKEREAKKLRGQKLNFKKLKNNENKSSFKNSDKNQKLK
jgi:predicted membrane protein